MNLNQLHYFITLAHMEHYTRAAEVLSITQPSLSHAISVLEEELGTYLFEKKGRNVVLTKYGKVFLKYAEASMDLLDTGIRKTKALTSVTSGVIDLGYIYTLGAEFVPSLLRKFLNDHQDLEIKINVTVGNTTEVIRGLKEEKYDVAFCSRQQEEKEVEFIPVTEEELVVIVPKGHELSGRNEIDLIETIPYPQIIFTPSSGLRPVMDDLFKRIRAVPKTAYEIEEDSAMAGMVAEQFGIAVLPNVPVLKQLNVDIIKIRKPEYRRYIYMAKMKNRYVSPIVRQFIQYVKTNYEIKG